MNLFILYSFLVTQNKIFKVDHLSTLHLIVYFLTKCNICLLYKMFFYIEINVAKLGLSLTVTVNFLSNFWCCLAFVVNSLFVICYSLFLFAICYSLFVIRYSLFAIRYSLFGIRYLLFPIRHSLFVIYYSLFVVSYSLFFIRYLLFVIRYSLFFICGTHYEAFPELASNREFEPFAKGKKMKTDERRS